MSEEPSDKSIHRLTLTIRQMNASIALSEQLVTKLKTQYDECYNLIKKRRDYEIETKRRIDVEYNDIQTHADRIKALYEQYLTK